MRRIHRPAVLAPSARRGHTALLLHCDGTDGSTTIVDSSPSARTPFAISGAAIDTDQSVFGGSSLYLAGTGGLQYTPDEAMAFGTRDFELTFWIRLAATGVNYCFGQYANGGGATKQSIWVTLQTDKLRFSAMSESTIIFNETSTVAMTVGNWAFFAFTRTSDAFEVRQGSTPGGATSVVCSGTSSASINSPDSKLGIGRLGNYDGGQYVNAHIDELRLRIGAAAVFSYCPAAPF